MTWQSLAATEELPEDRRAGLAAQEVGNGVNDESTMTTSTSHPTMHRRETIACGRDASPSKGLTSAEWYQTPCRARR
jgi:hypothetical protein